MTDPHFMDWRPDASAHRAAVTGREAAPLSRKNFGCNFPCSRIVHRQWQVLVSVPVEY
jgi:hypothetical protein